MAKSPFEDPEVQAMRASMRPSAGSVRWGRVATGVLIVACATFALAYYLPLSRAHELLAGRFAELQGQVDSSKRALQETRSKMRELESKQQALASQADQSSKLEKQQADASQAIKSTLESKLEKQRAKNQAAVGFAGAHAVAALAHDYLMTRGKLEVSAPSKAVLCSVAGAAGKRAIRVVAITEQKSIPAALTKTHKSPLQYSVAVAQVVADTLLNQCKVSPAQLSATGVPSEPATSRKLEGKTLSGSRVEIWLDAGQ
ncbi:MAG TPA: hypothetical protein VEX18_07190 [Polyangiaceae bacterium]|nr:hypothetical protein [Polyangiaceae bacterium]